MKATVFAMGLATALAATTATAAPEVGKSIHPSAMEPGDVIVSTAKKSGISWVIRAWTGADVSHALLYTGDEKVVEAVKEGVKEHKLADALGDATLAIVFRPTKLSKKQRADAALWAALQSGTRYSIGKLIKHPRFGILSPDCSKDDCRPKLGELAPSLPSEFFCSELVFWALQKVATSSSPSDIVPEASAPSDVKVLALLKEFEYIGHLRGGAK